jgi:acetyl-CoA C-acetyltransferase
MPIDPARIPVIVSAGQSIERSEPVDAVEMAVRAARAALDGAPGLAHRIGRLTMVAVSFSPVGKTPASEVARRLGLAGLACETTTPGGNTPQWLVNRAAAEIAAGQLEATLIVGGEATRSMLAADPSASFLGVATRGLDDLSADPVVGPSADSMLGPAELAARLRAPAEVYPLFESALAHAAGRDFAQQRAFLGPLMARFSEVAARNPYAWFPRARSAAEISEVTPDNRLTAEPYTKRMNSFPNVDLGCALLVCSLEAARRARLEERCLYIWSGATNAELPPAARPGLGDSPALRAAARAALDAAGVQAEQLTHIDVYSCFPSAVEVAADALGVSLDDPRGLTLTGGLPFAGGPGNNYTSHAIATLFERLRGSEGIGAITGNSGYLSKHSIGIYATRPPRAGFRLADTASAQTRLEAAALPVTADAGARAPATVEAATIVYARDGSPAAAPAVVRLADGRRAIAHADPAALKDLGGHSLVGGRVQVLGSPPVYWP